MYHATQHVEHFLKTIAKKRPNSHFGAFIRDLQLSVLFFKSNKSYPFSSFWTLLTLTNVTTIPSLEVKAHCFALGRHKIVLQHLFNAYQNPMHI